MRIARIVGARPQFMQIPTVMDAITRAGHAHKLIHTGQHYDTALDTIIFGDLQLPPADVNLNVGSGGHGSTTGRMLERIEAVLTEDRPDIVIVDGDTNSTLAGALAAAKLRIPVCHVEAGLRNFCRDTPEELNRVLTDHACDLACAPIPRAMDNLRNENLADRAVLVGDLLLDCFLHYFPRRKESAWRGLGLEAGKFHVLTVHRPENTDLAQYDRFREIMLAMTGMDRPVIFPVHPRTKQVLDRYKAAGEPLDNIIMTGPVGYLDMLGLVDAGDCIFTDSGGLPREAAWTGRKCVMLYRKVGWHDLVDFGWGEMGSTDRASIEDGYGRARIPDVARARAFFGDGLASEAIVRAIEARFAL
jgi:UDP-GlcNAc3NAcA epimerase